MELLLNNKRIPKKLINKSIEIEKYVLMFIKYGKYEYLIELIPIHKSELLTTFFAL